MIFIEEIKIEVNTIKEDIDNKDNKDNKDNIENNLVYLRKIQEQQLQIADIFEKKLNKKEETKKAYLNTLSITYKNRIKKMCKVISLIVLFISVFSLIIFSIYTKYAITKEQKSLIVEQDYLKEVQTEVVKERESDLKDIASTEVQQEISTISLALLENIKKERETFNNLVKENKKVKAYFSLPLLNIFSSVGQYIDNEYYLTHDIQDNENSLGWIFLDKSNSLEGINFNTVLYGHNLTQDKLFGNLYKILDMQEVKKEQKYIYLTTEYYTNVYEICSVYITKYTNVIYFNTEESLKAKENFITWLSTHNDKEIYDNKTISTTDAFITLSTCYGEVGTDERLVVQGKLVKSEKK